MSHYEIVIKVRDKEFADELCDSLYDWLEEKMIEALNKKERPLSVFVDEPKFIKG
jgi:hypothetical protein